MFSYQWFKENDPEGISRLVNINDIEDYLDTFIKDNKDILENMVLTGENTDDINRMYHFRKRLKYAKSMDLLRVVGEWIDLDKMNYIYAKRRGGWCPLSSFQFSILYVIKYHLFCTKTVKHDIPAIIHTP